MELKFILILFCILICKQEVNSKKSNKLLNQVTVINNTIEDPAEKLLYEHSANVNGAQRFITSLFPSLQLPNFASFMREAPPSISNTEQIVLNNKNEENRVDETVSPYYDNNDDNIYYEYFDENKERNGNFNDNDDYYGYIDEEAEEQIESPLLKRSIRSVPVIKVGIPSMPTVSITSLPSIPSMSTGIGNLVQNTMSAFTGLADQSMRLLMDMSSSAGLMVGDTTSSISNVLGAVSTFTSRLGSGITHFDEALTLEELKLVENTKNALAVFLNDLATVSSGSVRAFSNNPEEAEKFIAAQNDLIDATRESYVKIFNETTRGIQELERQMSGNPRQDSSPISSNLLTRLLRSASDSVRVMAELTQNLSKAVELSGRTRDPQALRKEIQSGTEQIKKTTNQLTEFQRQNVKQILRRNKRQRDVKRRTQELRRRRTKRRRRVPIRRKRKQNKRRRRRKNNLGKKRRNIKKKQNRNRTRRKNRNRKSKNKIRRTRRRRRKHRKNVKRRKNVRRRKKYKRRNRNNRRRKVVRERIRPNFRGRPVRFSLPIARNASEFQIAQPKELSKDFNNQNKEEKIQNKYENTENKNEYLDDSQKIDQNHKTIMNSEDNIIESKNKENIKVEKKIEHKPEEQEKQEEEDNLEKIVNKDNGLQKKKKKKEKEQKRHNIMENHDISKKINQDDNKIITKSKDNIEESENDKNGDEEKGQKTEKLDEQEEQENLNKENDRKFEKKKKKRVREQKRQRSYYLRNKRIEE